MFCGCFFANFFVVVVQPKSPSTQMRKVKKKEQSKETTQLCATVKWKDEREASK
jgi:hypothetical protein